MLDCIEKKTDGFCDKVCKRVPDIFCEIACKGDWKRFRRRRIDPPQKKVELTAEQKANPDLVSVIIVCDEGDRQYLEKTIKSIRENSVRPLEIIVFYDGFVGGHIKDCTVEFSVKKTGLRAALNHCVSKAAAGKYIVKLDAHCALSPEWDIRMKAACVGDAVIAPAIDRLDEKNWAGNGTDMSFATLDGNLRMQYIRPYSNISAAPLECEAICVTGCCFMMERDYYLKLGGLDENLGFWGALSPELSLKTWLTGGKILLRTDVVCSHLFREKTPFTVDKFKLDNAFKILCSQWICGTDNPLTQTRDASWLVTHFSYMNGYDIPMFGLGGFGHTIRPEDWKFLEKFINENNIKSVLEFGSGKSTLMFDQLGLKVTSIETIPLIQQTVKALSSDNVDIISNLNIKRPQDYSCDMVFIDGPKGGENRSPSYNFASMVDCGFIACHDAHRTWESKWIEKYLGGWKEAASMPDKRIRIFENALIRV